MKDINKEKLEKIVQGLIDYMPEDPQSIGINRVIAIEMFLILETLEKLIKEVRGDKFDYGRCT